MAITLNQHKNAITKRIISVYSDMNMPRMGLNMFFPHVTTSSKMVSIEVERNNQLLSPDVQRNTEANLNTFDKYTEKLFEPPYYEDEFDFTSIDRYDVTFGMGNTPTQSDARMMIDKASKYLMKLKYKQMRSLEKMSSDVLNTGILTFDNHASIDFKRKAASMKQLTGTDQWDDHTNSNPLKDLRDGAQFLREIGLSPGSMLKVVMGQEAFRNFHMNTEVRDQLDNRRLDKLRLEMPEMDNATGITMQGEISVGDYRMVVCTYNDFYKEEDGTVVKYLNENSVYLIPQDFEGKTAFAGIAAIVRDRNNAEFNQFISMIESDYYVDNYIDYRAKAHMFRIASSPLPIPVSIDKIYTISTIQS